MAFLNDLSIALNQFLLSATGLTQPFVFQQNLNSPSPTTKYITWSITSHVVEGLEERQNLSDTEIRKIYFNRRVLITVNCFNLETFETLENVRQKMTLDENIKFFRDRGLVISGNSSVTNASAVIDSEIEERAFFEIYFRYRDFIEENINAINEINFSGNLP